MKYITPKLLSFLLLILLFQIQSSYSQNSGLGIFENQDDIGKVGISGCG